MSPQKIGLVTASAICSINIWTGAPLFAVWVGSKVQGNLNSLSMTAVFSVILVLAALVLLLAWALTWINAKYDDLTRRHPEARHLARLRSLRDEREVDTRQKFGISLVERVLVVSVVACVLAFEVWFSSSPDRRCPLALLTDQLLASKPPGCRSSSSDQKRACRREQRDADAHTGGAPCGAPPVLVCADRCA